MAVDVDEELDKLSEKLLLTSSLIVREPDKLPLELVVTVADRLLLTVAEGEIVLLCVLECDSDTESEVVLLDVSVATSLADIEVVNDLVTEVEVEVDSVNVHVLSHVRDCVIEGVFVRLSECVNDVF